MFELNYPFKISEIAGRWGTRKNSDRSKEQSKIAKKEIDFLKKYRTEILNDYQNEGYGIPKLAMKYNSSIYRMNQFFKQKNIQKRPKGTKGVKSCRKQN